MGSRIRENVKHLIQCFCEVAGPKSADKESQIIQKFPDSYKDEEVLKSIPIFAYPCEIYNTVVQHYSFVLTSIDSKYTFGFCRHDPKTETALIVLSYLPWHESFYKLLNHIAEINHSKNSNELLVFLDAVYQRKVPDPGNTVEIPFDNGQSQFICQSPKQFQLPSIPENRNLTEYYNAVDTQNMMIIFASMLYERRIIVKSKKLYRLSACVQSANDIIYPMNWQHIFIPVLPMKLMDYLFAPMPYLIGVPDVIYDRVRKNDLGDVVVLDADTNTVETPFQDLASLPTDVVSSLRRHLRDRQQLLGDGVSRAFLRSLVQLIGGYRDALRFLQGQRITFNRELFVESRPPSMQPFLRQMLDLQIFQQFIEERLELLNNGQGFSDEFEKEACNYSEKSSSKLKHQYKEWTSTMRKEGSNFFKTVKNKANPAMKSAVKTVRERGKDVQSVYKDMRSKWRDPTPRDSLSVPSRADADKPHSAPTSPTQKRRPTTFAAPKHSLTATKSYRKGAPRHAKSTAGSGMRPYNALATPAPTEVPVVVLSDPGIPALQLSPLDMDLMGELKDVIYPPGSALIDIGQPPVDRTLKPVRSLESVQASSFGGSVPDSWWLPAAPTPAPSPPPPHPIAPQRVRHGHTALSRTKPQHGFAVTEFSPSPSPKRSLAPSTRSPSLDPSPPVAARSFQNVSDLSSPSHFASPPSMSSSFPTQFSPDFPFDGRDLFGAAPFVVSGGGSVDGDSVFVVASPSSVDLVRLPPPIQHASRSSKNQESTDLIRLDSTPDDEFDPILAKDKPAISSQASAARGPNLVVDQGMSNPLYPYFVPTINASSSARPVIGSSYSRQPGYEQDSALLKDYGIDFKSLSIQNGHRSVRPTMSPLHSASASTSASSQGAVPKDPFDSLSVFNRDTKQQKIPHNKWTKFE